MAAEIYFIEGGTLFAVDLEGNHRILSDGWSIVHSLTMSGGQVWAMQEETIFLVDPAGGSDRVHSRGWGSGSKRLAASGDQVMLIDGRGRLFSLDAEGGYRFLSDGWEETTAFCATRERFFAVDRGRLFEVFPGTGGNRFLSDGWGEIAGAAGLQGKVYLVSTHSGNIFEVDPESGREQVISREWFATVALMPCNDRLVAVDGRVIFEVDLSGAYRQISSDWGVVVCGTGPGD